MKKDLKGEKDARRLVFCDLYSRHPSVLENVNSIDPPQTIFLIFFILHPISEKYHLGGILRKMLYKVCPI